MEHLSDDCMGTPALVHVHMQEQGAVFSETMPLREVIVHLTKQLSVASPTEATLRTPSWAPQDTSLQTGQGD